MKTESALCLVFQLGFVEQNFMDLQDVVQVNLNSRAVLEHLETDSVLPRDCSGSTRTSRWEQGSLFCSIRPVGSAQAGCFVRMPRPRAGHASAPPAGPATVAGRPAAGTSHFLLRGLGQNVGAANRNQPNKARTYKPIRHATTAESAAYLTRRNSCLALLKVTPPSPNVGQPRPPRE